MVELLIGTEAKLDIQTNKQKKKKKENNSVNKIKEKKIIKN